MYHPENINNKIIFAAMKHLHLVEVSYYRGSYIPIYIIKENTQQKESTSHLEHNSIYPHYFNINKTIRIDDFPSHSGEGFQLYWCINSLV